MKIAFVVNRLTDYKLGGSLIDVALKKGADVECWLNVYQDIANPVKSYLVPAFENAPKFRYGTPDYHTYDSPSALAELAWSRGVDAIASPGTPTYHFGESIPENLPPWFSFQETVDFFVLNSPDKLSSICACGYYNEKWIKMASEFYVMREEKCAELGECAVESLGFDGVKAKLDSNADIVGPLWSDQKGMIDPAEVRERWNIERGRPVVLLLPCLDTAINQPYMQVGRVDMLKSIFASRLWNCLPLVFNKINDEHTSRTIREMCDRDGAFLLVKGRRKTRIPSYLSEIADMVIYDESFYPATIFEALSIADLCISHWSTVVVEAAAFGVPHLCMAVTENEMTRQGGSLYRWDVFYNVKEGGLYNYDGVSYHMSATQAVERLPSMSIGDFPLREEARRHYIDEYLGAVDGGCGERFIDAVMKKAVQR